jgi:cytochrome c oxidase subunit 2
MKDKRVTHGRITMRYAALLAFGLLVAGAPAAAQDRAAVIDHGKVLFTDRGCSGCHSVGGTGGSAAPDLSKIGTRLTEAGTKVWIRDPESHKLIVHSQLLHTLTDAEVNALAAFLSSLR